MYNDLSKLKLNLMLVRKASIRVAFFLFLVYLVVTFMPWQGWLPEELSSVSLFGFALLLFLCVTMAFLEDEVQKILNKSPFGGGLVGQFYKPENAMEAYNAGDKGKDDLFAPMEGSKLNTEGQEVGFDFPDQDDFDEDGFLIGGVVKFSDFKEDYLTEALKKLPDRTISDFIKRNTAIKEETQKKFDLVRNEFLSHVFGLPLNEDNEVEELPEGEDGDLYDINSHLSGSYQSAALLRIPGDSRFSYQNRLVELFGAYYEITFVSEFDDDPTRGTVVKYRLK
jgi:hypothetical protein